MKNILFIIGLIIAIFLFASEKETNGDQSIMAQREAVMKEKNAATDMQHRLEIISNDLRNSNCLTPRRNIQTTNHVPAIRVTKSAERILHYIRLKDAGQLQKVSEYVTVCQTINFSALLCSTGYHVYALRKIII